MYACDEPSGTVTASLRYGSIIVARAAKTVTVTQPTIAIYPQLGAHTTVMEGEPLRFTVTISTAPLEKLTVTLSIGQAPEASSFLTGDIPSTIDIEAGTTSADFVLNTINDEVDEPDGTVVVAVVRGDGYNLGDPTAQIATVEDNDTPAIPIGLRANGNINNGEVDVWWDAATGVTSYDLRYAVDCPGATLYSFPYGCEPGPWTTVTGITSSSKRLSAGDDSGNQLSTNVVTYRLEVRTVNDDMETSDWSQLAFIHPSDSPPAIGNDNGFTRLPHVATASLYAYLPNNELEYIICDHTRPSAVRTDASRIATHVENWESVAKESRNSNMLTITRLTQNLPEGACDPPGRAATTLVGTGHNEVMFVDKKFMEMAQCSMEGFGREPAPSCYRTRTILRLVILLHSKVETLPPLEKGWLMLRDTLPEFARPNDWNALAHNGVCTYAEHKIAHELGHALGIGGDTGGHDAHPYKDELSIMSSGYEDGAPLYCEPPAYDAVTIMAIYQSR